MSSLVTKTRVEFKRTCTKQDEITYDERKIAKIFIVYEMNKNFNVSSYPTLGNCLFGAVILTKSVDINKYEYSGYGIGFDRHRFFLYSSDGTGRNVINIGVDMSFFNKNW